jgi:trans-aconitate methyltransferase
MNFNDYADSYNSDLIDQKAIYKLFTSKRDFFFEYKFDILVRHIKTSPQNILDFGCGVGLCLPYLKNIFPRGKISATDISESSLSVVSNLYPDVNIIPDHQLSNNHYDLIFCSGVFHHIPFDERLVVLRRLIRCLNPGGILCVFEHNPYNPITQRMVSSCIFDQDAQLISRNNMEKMIKILPFEILTSKYCLFFPEIFSKWKRIERHIGWIPFGGQYFILAEKT